MFTGLPILFERLVASFCFWDFLDKEGPEESFSHLPLASIAMAFFLCTIQCIGIKAHYFLICWCVLSVSPLLFVQVRLSPFYFQVCSLGFSFLYVSIHINVTEIISIGIRALMLGLFKIFSILISFEIFFLPRILLQAFSKPFEYLVGALAYDQRLFQVIDMHVTYYCLDCPHHLDIFAFFLKISANPL